MMQFRKFIAAGTACLWLYGVAVGQTAPLVGDAQSPDQATQGVLTLEEAIKQAQKISLQLALQDSRVREKQATVTEAQARQWPAINIQASGSYLTNPQDGIVIKAGSLGFTPSPGSTYPVPFPSQDIVLMEGYEHTYFKVDTTLNWPLITWGKVENAINLAQLGLQLEQLERSKSGKALAKDVHSAFSGVLVAQRSLAVLEQALTLLTTIMQDKERAFGQGLATKAEVLETRKNLEQLKSRHLSASMALRSARAGLGMLCGLDPDASDRLVVDGVWHTASSIPDTNELWQRSIIGSPDRQGIQLQNRMADAAVALQQASQLLVPDIALNVQFGITGQRIPVVQANWTDTWDYNLIITLATQIPVFDGGTKGAHLTQAQEKQSQARLGLELNDRALRVRIQSLVEQVQSGIADLSYKQTALELAREQEKNARESWENELLTRDQYQLANLQALLAGLELELAGYNLDKALTELEYLAGGLE